MAPNPFPFTTEQCESYGLNEMLVKVPLLPLWRGRVLVARWNVFFPGQKAGMLGLTVPEPRGCKIALDVPGFSGRRPL